MRHKTVTLAAVVLLAATGLPAAHASSPTAADQARAFATCTGRLQALATRQQAIGDPGSRRTRRALESFESLLEAILPILSPMGIGPGEAERWRTHGWVEIATLLRREQFSSDEARAARARLDRARRIHTCERMILPG